MAQLVTGEDRMDVRVDESGKQGAAVQVDRDRLPRRPPLADLGNLPAVHLDGAAFREEAAAVEDGPAMENDVVPVRHCRSPHPVLALRYWRCGTDSNLPLPGRIIP